MNRAELEAKALEHGINNASDMTMKQIKEEIKKVKNPEAKAFPHPKKKTVDIVKPTSRVRRRRTVSISEEKESNSGSTTSFPWMDHDENGFPQGSGYHQGDRLSSKELREVFLVLFGLAVAIALLIWLFNK